MDALWRGVQTNSLSAALPAFFPEAAYAQVKAISDPQADWRDRLVGTFRLDIGAAHALLSDGGSRARLVRVACARGVRPLGRPRRLLQPDRLLRGAECPRRVSGRAVGALVRDRLDDLVAGGVVRRPPRRGQRRCDRNGRRAELRARHLSAVADVLVHRSRETVGGWDRCRSRLQRRNWDWSADREKSHSSPPRRWIVPFSRPDRENVPSWPPSPGDWDIVPILRPRGRAMPRG